MRIQNALVRFGMLPMFAATTAAVVAMSSHASTTAAISLSPLVESGVIGGAIPCGFLAGVAGGLTIGGFLGCIPCGVAGGVGGLFLLVVC